MRIEEDIKLDYADVLFRPKRSTLSSRKDVELKRTYKFKYSNHQWTGTPIIAANMDGVGELEIAKNLANSLVSVAKGAGLNCEAILTDMNQVLGRTAGHSLEVKECTEYLVSKKRDSRLEIVTNELASSCLMMIKKISKEESIKLINRVLDNGKAAEQFEKMIYALGGSNSFLSTYKNELSNNMYTEDINLGKQGWIKEVDTRELGLILIELGGGRKQINDKIVSSKKGKVVYQENWGKKKLSYLIQKQKYGTYLSLIHI